MNRSTLYAYPCSDNSSCNGFQIYLEPGYWKLECWGASGGDSYNKNKNTLFLGGRGGYSVGVVNVVEREVFYLTIGGSGYSLYSSNERKTISGGYNGGGSGQVGTLLYPAASGGGGTDIRRGGKDIDNRIIVAGGGGGAGAANSNYIDDDGQYGGAGGGLEGLQGGHYDSEDYSSRPTGGTQDKPGKMGYTRPTEKGEDGELWKGGDVPSLNVESSGGGGGGGFYGGGSSHATGGAGGSGYVGKVISYGKTIAATFDGKQEIPNPLGGSEIGHLGHGYIRITDVTYKPVTCQVIKFYCLFITYFCFVFIK